MKYDLVIVDGDNIAYKNYYANIKLSYNGELTGVLFGFIKSLISLRKTFSKEVIVTWSHNNKFRKNFYPEYKATRKKEGKEDFFRQLNILIDFLSALGIPQVKLPDREADDVIYYINDSLPELNSIIISEDKDMFQLLDQKTHQFKRSKIYTEELFKEEYGFDKKFLPLYLAIVGDKSDNIIGVPQIGKKKATKLIQNFGIEIFEMLNSYTSELYTDKNLLKVIEHSKVVLLNLKLIELSRTQKILPEENMIKINKDENKVIEYLSKYGLASVISEVLEIYHEN